MTTGNRRAAYVRLAREHAATAYGLARRLLGDPTEAEDVVQESFLKAWRGLGRFRREAELKTWLFRILVNACRDRLRRRVLREHVPDPAPRPSLEPSVRAERAEFLGRVWEAVEKLPPRQRECLLLRARAGLGHRDMAQLLGIGIGMVKQHLVAARRALFDHFGEEVKEWGILTR